MKTDWKELTLQEKKAGAYNPFCSAIELHGRTHDVPGLDKSVPELARGIGEPSATSHNASQTHR